MRHPRASQVPTIQHDHPADDRTDTTRRLEALLAPVKGVLSMNALLLETPLSAEQRDLAAGVRASAESLLEAINRILDVSLVEAGRLELADETFDLHAVISGAGAIVRPIATRKGLWLSVRLDPDLPVAVRGDAARLRQILLDLLGNAVKFTDRGSVQVRGTLAAADADRLRIRLEIVDTGSGVPSDQLLGLLRSRGAVEPDGPRRLGGSSLGLPVTRELVELMGGALDVVSAAGEGSRFTATITLRPGDDSALERHLPDDEGTIVGTPLAGRRVLLVDDHPVNRASAQAALQRLGADVDIAWDGLDALDRFEPRRYDAVILDVRMPNMDGYEAAREMRRREDDVMAARTPILALTAAALEEERQLALAAGMDAHLGKPFHAAELAAALGDLLETSDARSLASPGAATAADPDPGVATAVGSAAPTEPGAMRVLIVDDSPVNRRVAEVLVQGRGFEAAVAENGPAALERLASEPFDLVLLDGMMPGLDGPAVAREIRRREAAAGLEPIAIIALTASFLPEDRERMLEAGMDDHLAKPFTAEAFDLAVERRLPAGTGRRTRPIPARAARATDPAIEGPPILDLAAVERLADLGSPQLVERIVRLFMADAAERVAQVDDAIADRDLARLQGAIMALEGICDTVGATALDRRARAIHDEVRRRRDRGEDPFARALGPSGLEPLLDATRIRLQERLPAQARRGS